MPGNVHHRMTRVLVPLLSLVGLLLTSCGGSMPSPSITEHPRDAYVDVPYPPPAALAETVPDRPDVSALVWLDGDWSFRGKAYGWRRGGWFVAPTGARYAPSKLLYLKDGRLRFAAGAWYDAQGEVLTRQRALRPAETPLNEVTSEFQTGR